MITAKEIEDFVNQKKAEDLMCASGNGCRLTYSFLMNEYCVTYRNGLKRTASSVEDAVDCFNDEVRGGTKNRKPIDTVRSHPIAIDKYTRGEPYMCSVDISDTPSYGYGELNDLGFFKFPLYFEDRNDKK